MLSTLGNLARGLRSRCVRRLKDTTPKERKTLFFLIILLFIALLFVIPWVIQDQISPPVAFWIQAFAGNWSPPDQTSIPPVGRYWFALLGVVALLLNFGAVISLILAVSVIRRLIIRNQERRMKVTEAYKARDHYIKEAICKYFPEKEQDKIDELLEKAFAEGTMRWAQGFLPIEFASDKGAPDLKKAEEVLRMVEDRVFG